MRATRKSIAVLAVLFALIPSACQRSGGVHTLYRDSATGREDDKTMRVHVATFDSTNGEAYNLENCQVAQGLFQKQPGVRVRFWCEKGAYRE